MRYSVVTSVLCLLIAQFAAAQQSARQETVYTYDAHGRRVAAATSNATGNGGSFRAETTQSVNGRRVPLEKVEEKVIADGPNGRIIERTVRRYDADGRPGQSEKVRIEEKRDASGTSTVSTSVFDADINGRFALRERATERTTASAGVRNSNTVVERPNINGSLDTVEKREAVQTGDDKRSLLDVKVYRRDANGSFTQAERETTETVVDNGQTTVSEASYNTSSTGKLDLAGQRVSRIRKNPDGSEVEVVELYGDNRPGHARDGSVSAPVLREQQIIERQPGAGESMTETFSIRRPDLHNGNLGPVQKISETVCTGKCRPDPVPAK